MSDSSSVCSSVACATAAAPMLPLAPVLFSMNTFTPSVSPSGLAISRAITSEVPPGGNGTTMRSGLLGQAAAANAGMPTVA